ncbi:SGNH hydrolase-type esterase domain-containing protein [Dactylonectria estremocensis]|uniref:SGNH hydrolase-type esterase domain-containing protein n=1 Tax=Dactylonectria estremocensis TaxID=1079267 RepID=A0A9P9E343_9HYPO|nr:SGNH hydrolase-type esterase domain-containing protein [Dactylonectria estremocensis]
MKLHHVLSPAIFFGGVIGKGTDGVVGGPIGAPSKFTPPKPPYFLIAGDSTAARDYGWGDGFFRNVKNSASGKNYAKWGATTETYRFDKCWDRVLDKAEEAAENHLPVVMLQFGHYHEIEGRDMRVNEYRSSLVEMTREVVAAGGVPVVLSPLPRRVFKNNRKIGSVSWSKEPLEEVRWAALNLDGYGAETLDLYGAAAEYLNSIGEALAVNYQHEPGEDTLLNDMGSNVFGTMVADLLQRKMPELSPYFQSRRAVSTRIWAGVYTGGDEKTDPAYDDQGPDLPSIDVKKTHDLDP